jgi:RHS repeat-associated protein
VALSESYAPYGQVLAVQGEGQSSYGFDGEWTDNSVGLVNLRARMYDADLGRFTSQDTWEGDENSPVSLNRWNYAEGNPVNLVDPSGHDAIVVNDIKGFRDFGHNSVLLQDKGGTWFYSYWGGDTAALKKVDDENALITLSGLNSWLSQNSLPGGNYTRSVYIKGDFSKSYDRANDYYSKKDGSYNLVFNNCSEVTFTVLNYGKLDDGTSFSKIFDGSRISSPDDAYVQANGALYNNAYTIEEYKTQLNAYISFRKMLLGLAEIVPCQTVYGSAYQKEWINEIERAEKLLGNSAHDS